MKIKQIQCHLGVKLNYQVLTGVSAEKHKVSITPNPEWTGVFIKGENDHHSFVPFTNISDILFESEPKNEPKVITKSF